jgi:hypothetical protein
MLAKFQDLESLLNPCHYSVVTQLRRSKSPPILKAERTMDTTLPDELQAIETLCLDHADYIGVSEAVFIEERARFHIPARPTHAV